MPKYRILITPSAVKEIEAIGTKRDRQTITAQIGRLADDPRPPGCVKLAGDEKYRIRQGNYRVVYSIEDRHRAVYVVKVGHRKEAYR